jgi:hypothetical protein
MTDELWIGKELEEFGRVFAEIISRQLPGDGEEIQENINQDKRWCGGDFYRAFSIRSQERYRYIKLLGEWIFYTSLL